MQPDLFTPLVDTSPEPDPPLTSEERREAAALAFHEANPHVYEALVKWCRIARDQRGYHHWGIQAALEVVRFSQITTDHRTYKLNNNHAKYYARWIMRDLPEFAGFFETREHGRVPQEYDE